MTRRGADLGGLLAEAAGLLAEGELVAAERLYRRILALDPDQLEALHALGGLAAQTGRGADAVDLLERAIAVDGRVAALHYTLSEVLEVEGRPAEALLNRGNGLRAEGRLAEASDCYWRALALDAGLAGGYANLGLLLLARGDSAAAVAALRQALTLRPGYALAESGLGAALVAQTHPGDAIEHFERAFTLDPRCAEAASGLGDAYHSLGDWDEAAPWYARALGVRADLPEAHFGLARLERDRGRLVAAADGFARAALLRPLWTEALVALGAARLALGRAAEAVEAYRRALETSPDSAAARSGLLLALQYDESATSADLAAEQGAVESAWAAGLADPRPHQNGRDSERRLRIGYVSPDLRRGGLAAVLEPVLANHDRRQVEIVLYAEVSRPDLMTSRLKALADHWRDTVGLDDAAMAERVRADGVDILVDLAGHRPGNRLPVFARRAAPVQVGWLGYPDATGLSAIDWRFTDGVVERENVAADRLMRLPRGLCCWSPPPDAPPVAPMRSGPVTFGALVGLPRLSPGVVAAWSELLRRVPESRLVIATRALADAAVADAVRARFGAVAGRVEVVGLRSDSRLETARGIDVALDTFPINDPAAIREALWMGVPVVTVRGDRPGGRIGASLLTRIGLEPLIAEDVHGYVAIAAALAGDHNGRANARETLRARVAASPLLDAPGFVRTLESAYRTIWRRWCRNG